MAHGVITSKLARSMQQEFNHHGYDVLYDHGLQGIDPEDKLGKIRSWYGTVYSSKAILADIDIAVVAKGSGNVSALIEIEETTDKPKVILGDVMATLLGSDITFQGKRVLKVGKWTMLVVMARSTRQSHLYRMTFLEDQANQMKRKLSTPNAVIGRIILDTFDTEQQLKNKLADHIWQIIQGNKG